MRPATLILSAAVTLTAQAALPGYASAATVTGSQVVASASDCPVFEGYPGCHPAEQYPTNSVVNERAA